MRNLNFPSQQHRDTKRSGLLLEADDTQLVKNAEGFYEIPAVTKAENILVTYKEIPQEPAANTGSTEESEEETVEEPIEENTDEFGNACDLNLFMFLCWCYRCNLMQNKVYCQKELPWNWHLYPMLRLQQQ